MPASIGDEKSLPWYTLNCGSIPLSRAGSQDCSRSRATASATDPTARYVAMAHPPAFPVKVLAVTVPGRRVHGVTASSPGGISRRSGGEPGQPVPDVGKRVLNGRRGRCVFSVPRYVVPADQAYPQLRIACGAF